MADSGCLLLRPVSTILSARQRQEGFAGVLCSAGNVTYSYALCEVKGTLTESIFQAVLVLKEE